MNIEEKIEEEWRALIGDGFKDITIDEFGWKKLKSTERLVGYNCSYVGGYQQKGYNPMATGRDSHKQSVFVRPSKLRGIESNNGWIKIESKEDLPEEGVYSFHYLSSDKVIYNKIWDSHKIKEGYKHNLVTHYKPVVVPKMDKPHY